jgi:mono/diheme cytochrome c family protein
MLLALTGLTACTQKMADQPRYNPLTASDFFPDGMSARPLADGTVARGHLRNDELFYTGRSGKILATTFPFPVTREVLDRGRERFDIFCAPCHGRLGKGDGIVVQRGMRAPPSYHIDRLREAPPGHFFDAITNGFGAMASSASRIPPRDRWAIIAYIRALQLSQNATVADVPAEERQKFLGGEK